MLTATATSVPAATVSAPATAIDGSLKLRKPLEALVMVPRTNKLSALGRKMYNVLLYISQGHLKTMQCIPAANFLFEAPLNEILKVCGADGQLTSAKKSFAEMRKADVVWDSPDSTTEFSQIGFSLLSETRISKRSGTVWVHWALPPSLYETLADPERWASIDLLMLAGLDTYAAVVLYEICTKYRNNPTHVTCRREPSWWVEILCATPSSVDPRTGLKKYPEWRKYKHSFVNSAIEQICENTDLHIELLEVCAAHNKVLTVQFKVTIKRNTSQVLEDVTNGEINQDLVAHAIRLGVKNYQEIASITRAHGERAVKEGLHNLEQRQKQLSLPDVRSPSGYLRNILGEKKEVVQEQFDEGWIDASKPLSASVLLNKNTFSGESAQINVAIPDNNELAKERRNSVFQELLSLQQEEMQHWLDAYGKKMKADNQFSASVKNRLSLDKWTVGMVKAGVVNFYGTAKYGRGWPYVLEM